MRNTPSSWAFSSNRARHRRVRQRRAALLRQPEAAVATRRRDLDGREAERLAARQRREARAPGQKDARLEVRLVARPRQLPVARAYVLSARQSSISARSWHA